MHAQQCMHAQQWIGDVINGSGEGKIHLASLLDHYGVKINSLVEKLTCAIKKFNFYLTLRGKIQFFSISAE